MTRGVDWGADTALPRPRTTAADLSVTCNGLPAQRQRRPGTVGGRWLRRRAADRAAVSMRQVRQPRRLLGRLGRTLRRLLTGPGRRTPRSDRLLMARSNRADDSVRPDLRCPRHVRAEAPGRRPHTIVWYRPQHSASRRSGTRY